MIAFTNVKTQHLPTRIVPVTSKKDAITMSQEVF